MIARPCITCGTIIRTGTRCPDCTRTKDRQRPHRKKTSSTTRGYGTRWRRLSLLARQRQPFCSDCGATQDLQADHSPEAWDRHEQCLPIRLVDIDVVCGTCNRRRGAARGKGAQRRSKPPNTPNQTRSTPND